MLRILMVGSVIFTVSPSETLLNIIPLITLEKDSEMKSFMKYSLILLLRLYVLSKEKILNFPLGSSHIEAFSSDKEAEWRHKFKDF